MEEYKNILFELDEKYFHILNSRFGNNIEILKERLIRQLEKEGLEINEVNLHTALHFLNLILGKSSF